MVRVPFVFFHVAPGRGFLPLLHFGGQGGAAQEGVTLVPRGLNIFEGRPGPDQPMAAHQDMAEQGIEAFGQTAPGQLLPEPVGVDTGTARKDRKQGLAQSIEGFVAETDGPELVFHPVDKAGMIDDDGEKDLLLLTQRVHAGAEAGLGIKPNRGRRATPPFAARRAQVLPHPVVEPLQKLRPDGRIVDGSGMIAQALFKRRPLLRRVPRAAPGFHPPQQVRERQGVIEGAGDEFPPVALDLAVRVLARLQERETQRITGLEQGQGAFGGAERRALARRVPVEAEHRLARQPPQLADLVFGQGRAQGRDGVLEPGPDEGDDVHVALGDDEGALLARRRRRLGQAVQHPALVEERGLRGVEVLGLAGAEDSSAEGDDPPALVGDGEHDAPAEAVIGRAGVVVGPDQKAGGDQQVLGDAVAGQRPLDGAPGVHGKAQAEPRDGLVIQAAAAKIRQPLAALGHAERLLEIGAGRLHHIVKGLALAGPLALFGGVGRNLHPRVAGQALDRLGKAHAFGVHDEVDDAAVGSAPEAVVEPLVLVDRERRGLLLVERAQPDVLASLAGQAHPPPDRVGEARTGAQLVKKLRRKRHAGWSMPSLELAKTGVTTRTYPTRPIKERKVNVIPGIPMIHRGRAAFSQAAP